MFYILGFVFFPLNTWQPELTFVWPVTTLMAIGYFGSSILKSLNRPLRVSSTTCSRETRKRMKSATSKLGMPLQPTSNPSWGCAPSAWSSLPTIFALWVAHLNYISNFCKIWGFFISFLDSYQKGRWGESVRNPGYPDNMGTNWGHKSPGLVTKISKLVLWHV